MYMISLLATVVGRWKEESKKSFHIHMGTGIKPLVPDLYAWRNVQKNRISMRAV
jgi:hypothetical protein